MDVSLFILVHEFPGSHIFSWLSPFLVGAVDGIFDTPFFNQSNVEAVSLFAVKSDVDRRKDDQIERFKNKRICKSRDTSKCDEAKPLDDWECCRE
jgi:hypothetical protein